MTTWGVDGGGGKAVVVAVVMVVKVTGDLREPGRVGGGWEMRMREWDRVKVLYINIYEGVLVI